MRENKVTNRLSICRENLDDKIDIGQKDTQCSVQIIHLLQWLERAVIFENNTLSNS